MFSVYVLFSQSHGTRYVGSTEDLEKRLKRHQAGRSRYTSCRGPWILVHKEEFQTKTEALGREKYFKTGKGREELDRILKSQHSGVV